MRDITDIQIKRRLQFDNPWWGDPAVLDRILGDRPERAYLSPFHDLVTNRGVNRAVVLMGPRRVGKTVMLQQSIKRLLVSGVERTRVFFVDLQNPVYVGLGLQRLLDMFLEMFGHDRFSDLYVLFDEIQYLKEWEVHLKVLVDSYPSMRFVVSGSAAAALKMKSRESGAGRFTDFLLPPLTFAEFLKFRGIPDDERDIERLNGELLAYVEFGGFPEAVLVDQVRADFQRFVSSDIIEKVLLKDIPSLYGIDDPQELNRFFTMLAFNTGNEISLDELSKKSGAAKNTIKKYLDYLEAAFLIHRLYRVDLNARHFRRATTFKVYLTNPCLRSALFGMPEEKDMLGHLIETAVVAQFIHHAGVGNLHYARWKDGEVDLVALNAGTQKPVWAYEVKWRDKLATDDFNSIIKFCHNNGITNCLVSSETIHYAGEVHGMQVQIAPVSDTCRDFGLWLNQEYMSKGIHPRRLLPEE
ncbi:ATPase [Paramagnetospirillum kuznetsovii]|uniref:ATPase n=1 Tax=Paramagnetospirillum kuznetsovii TaxID=2053833 RepID=A0A364P1A3_9PROT|nr:ATP-binding protein [Paramagnetospirillum kuznetsovii]RAU23128.1 ATPase [Paramagnetospirillum kuznetsovii]